MKWVMAVVMLAACQRAKPTPVEKTAPVVVVAATTTGIKACDDYLRRVAACTKLTPAMRETLAYGGGVWNQAGSSATESCEGVAKLAEPQLIELGC